MYLFHVRGVFFLSTVTQMSIVYCWSFDTLTKRWNSKDSICIFEKQP